MSSTAWLTLAPELARLEAYYVACTAAVQVIPGTTKTQRDAATTVLNTARYWLNRLGPTGELGKGVIAGTVAPSRWVNVANEQGRTMQVALEALSPLEGVVAAWEEIVINTAADVGELAQDTAAAASASLPWVAVALLAVAFIYGVRAFR